MWYQWLVLSIPDSTDLSALLDNTFSHYVVDDWGYDGLVHGSKTISIQAIQDTKEPRLDDFQESFTWYRWLWVNCAVRVGSSYSGSNSSLESFNNLKATHGFRYARGRTVSNLIG